MVHTTVFLFVLDGTSMTTNSVAQAAAWCCCSRPDATSMWLVRRRPNSPGHVNMNIRLLSEVREIRSRALSFPLAS
jgi:hypothetical protein